MSASVRQPPSAAQSLSPASYHRSEVAAAEIAMLRRSWIGIGRADQVTAENNCRVFDIAGTPVILTRDGDGELHLLANTCRHRGARLLAETPPPASGPCRTMQCPFHGWTYRTDGSLLAAPKMAELDGFSVDAHGLVSYRVEDRLGFLFACLDAEAPELDEVLGDFAEVHAPWPLASLITVRRRELTVDCNWKAFLEVFNDYYHLPFVHRESLGDTYARPEPRDETVGAFATQFGATTGTGALLVDEQQHALPPMPGLPVREAGGVRYSWAFPTMTFAAGAEALWVYEAHPDGPERCRVVQTCCLPPATVADASNADKIDAYLRRLDAALDEDIDALVNQHQGLRSPDAQPGPFQPRLEPSVAAFAAWYRDEMQAALNDTSNSNENT